MQARRCGAIRYFVGQLECEARLHVQGYIQFSRQLSNKQFFIEHWGDLGRGFHFKRANGTPSENKTYCTKAERGDWRGELQLGEDNPNGRWEFGEMVGADQRERGSGARARELVDQLAGDATLGDILRDRPELVYRNAAQLRTWRVLLNQGGRTSSPTGRLIIIWGESGIGKSWSISRLVSGGAAALVERGWITGTPRVVTVDTSCASSGKLWADPSWAGKNIIWLDNFAPTRGDGSGGGGVPAEALRVLVGHCRGEDARHLASKGGSNVLLLNELTIIASVHDPHEWYSGTQDYAEIQRRIADPDLCEVHHLTEQPASLREFLEERARNGGARPRLRLD